MSEESTAMKTPPSRRTSERYQRAASRKDELDADIAERAKRLAELAKGILSGSGERRAAQSDPGPSSP